VEGQHARKVTIRAGHAHGDDFRGGLGWPKVKIDECEKHLGPGVVLTGGLSTRGVPEGSLFASFELMFERIDRLEGRGLLSAGREAIHGIHRIDLRRLLPTDVRDNAVFGMRVCQADWLWRSEGAGDDS